ncbi:hypothetical protein [Paenarthrobacter nitroguajacolicus]|uniref:hypothetical protein n=1 Tax=Paenarthrobacter nitroguajacolicus TaxID=211146 RepID=UPI00142E92D7|nr:hypothetical protein [Paenarthrobacter nitroguajacolicus]
MIDSELRVIEGRPDGVQALSCRMYSSAGNMAGLPALGSLLAAVRGSGQEA